MLQQTRENHTLAKNSKFKRVCMGQMGRRRNVNWAEGRDCDSENGGGELVGGSDPGGFTCGHGGDKTGASKPYSHWFILGHPFSSPSLSIYSSFFLQTHGAFGRGLIFQTTQYPIKQVSLTFTHTQREWCRFFYLFASFSRFTYFVSSSTTQLTHGIKTTPFLGLFVFLTL